MIPQEHSLRQLFHDLVVDCYESRIGIADTEISTYVADLLTEFSRSENIFRIRDAHGNPLKEVSAMLLASDPVHGTAASFDEEREFRKHIGDYALFFTGMYPEAGSAGRRAERQNYLDMVQAGKESYYIVSQFDLFEYAQEAPFFARMAGAFEECIRGLNLVRAELDRLRAMPPPPASWKMIM